MFRGLWSITNPLYGIWLWSPLYEVMLWNQPFFVTSLQKERGCYPWDQFCAEASQMAQPTSIGKKIWSWALFVSMVNVSVKAFEDQEWKNGHISATKPPIKIVSTLFTLQLLISLAMDCKNVKKGFVAKNGSFPTIQMLSIPWVGLRSISSEKLKNCHFWLQNLPFLTL